MKPSDAFEEARREFERQTAHLTDAEFEAAINRLVQEVRAERRVRYVNMANVTEQDIEWRRDAG